MPKFIWLPVLAEVLMVLTLWTSHYLGERSAQRLADREGLTPEQTAEHFKQAENHPLHHKLVCCWFIAFHLVAVLVVYQITKQRGSGFSVMLALNTLFLGMILFLCGVR